MKKVVIFGGGSGLSQLLKGMVQFPWDVTAVVSVSDNGKSTGKLRKEFDIPAVGDITKVIMSMSGKNDTIKELFMHRFDDNSSLNGHSIKNLIMTALLDKGGDFAHAIPILCDLLDVKGNIYPVTEDNVELIGITKDDREIVGESQITAARSVIKSVRYNKTAHVSKNVLEELEEADLIIFSTGSLITSVLPHIIIPEIQEAVKYSKAKKMYICNMITQPGETDNFYVSDHLKTLEKFLGKNVIDAVLVNNAPLPEDMSLLAKSEGKSPVEIDHEVISNMGINIIEDEIFMVEDGYIRHDSLKTAYLMFSYLMKQKIFTKLL